MTSLADELRQTSPLAWERIAPDNRPDVSRMISLLQEMGVQMQSRPSGAACLRVLVEHAAEIEQKLAAPPSSESQAEPEPQTREPETQQSEPQTRELPPQLDDFDETMQCANTVLAEAHERLIACVTTSYKTDTGLILLENELSMFHEQKPEDVSSWVQEMRYNWESRLHSKVLNEFYEALDLWVVSQEIMWKD